MERIATIERKTAETEISLTINLDGTGKCDMENPIGFFNHMLNSFCKHGLFDISGSLKGDLDVDQHHLIEDTGIALGMAFAKALGNCAGIFRSGSCLYPMDECLCQAAVDFGGRPYLVCNAELTGTPLVSINQDGKEAFAYAKSLNPKASLEILIKKIYCSCYAKIRFLLKQIYIKVRMGSK